METVHELSAGGVACLRDPLRVALIRVRDRWGLPKGLAEKGERLADAALREVREETGFAVELAGPAHDIEYWFVMGGNRHHKRVRFFLMWIREGDAIGHDDEVDEVRLFDPKEALQHLAYDNERLVLEQALRHVGAA